MSRRRRSTSPPTPRPGSRVLSSMLREGPSYDSTCSGWLRGVEAPGSLDKHDKGGHFAARECSRGLQRFQVFDQIMPLLRVQIQREQFDIMLHHRIQRGCVAIVEIRTFHERWPHQCAQGCCTILFGYAARGVGCTLSNLGGFVQDAAIDVSERFPWQVAPGAPCRTFEENLTARRGGCIEQRW